MTRSLAVCALEKRPDLFPAFFSLIVIIRLNSWGWSTKEEPG